MQVPVLTPVIQVTSASASWTSPTFWVLEVSDGPRPHLCEPYIPSNPMTPQ